MTPPERHARIQEIFQAAIELQGEPRNAYLNEACGSDAELRAYILNLVAADDSTETIDDGSARQAALWVKECHLCKRCYDDLIAVCPADGEPLRPAFPGNLLVDRKYRIERFIGRGGMGAVYLVNHLHLEKRFALKLISTGDAIAPQRRRNFETEARLLAQLKHPHIVDVTDSGVDERGQGMPYLVMEYLEGRTVQDLVDDHPGGLPVPEAIALLRQVAEGIDAAHDRNIVHGDLKPANLFLARGVGKGETAKIVDFGLARLSSRRDGEETTKSAAVSGGIRGTPAFMAPELFCGEDASPASDRFALGVLAYELLTGALPFGWHPMAVMDNQQNPPVTPSVRNSRIPPELDHPVLTLLSPAPDKRPASSMAAVTAIEKAWLAARQREWREREGPRRLPMAALGAAVAILIAGAIAKSPAGQTLEDRTVDARFAMASPSAPDPRLLLILLDEETLASNPRPLAEWDQDFARTIDGVFAAGASRLAIDLLLPNWSLSPEFGRAVAAHVDQLALAKYSTGSGSVVGTECVGPLAAYSIGADGPSRLAAAFGFVNLDADSDGGMRRPHIVFTDRLGAAQPAFAARAALADSGREPLPKERVWVDYATRSSDISKLSWKDVAGRLHDAPDFFRDRLIIVGAAWAGSDDLHPLPASASRDLVPGAVIQALIANTILRGFPVRDAGLLRYLLLMTPVCFGLFLLALRFPHRAALAFLAGAAALCGYGLLSFALFRWPRIVLPFTGPELAVMLTAIVAWILKNRLTPYPQ